MPEEFPARKCEHNSNMFPCDGSQDPQDSPGWAPPQEVHREVCEFLQYAEHDTRRVIFRDLLSASDEKTEFAAASDSPDLSTGQSQGGGRS